ncbi:hypothetical protein JMUB7507_26570 [Staphylococcus aureus]
MSWDGNNDEDAVIMSERQGKEDGYTSIQIEEYKTEARNTKLGPEKITRDLHNVSKSAIKT